ncbi:MAG TPA: pentapeptide repeat-containing protein [Puia sp.]|jgi:uncharacterized protein YjbI with pentapeptide repeats|nr:pentapeptide repeat-containing protein [Puia sp.]
MANPEHVAILKQGVETWNQWMKYEYNGWPGGRREPDLSQLDFSFLREFDYHRFIAEYIPHPSEINELHSEFHAGRLSYDEMKLGWKNLNQINLTSADLSGADLSGIGLNNAMLFSTNLKGANLESASLYNARLDYANLTYANLRFADLRGVRFNHAQLSNAKLNGANLERAIMADTILQAADLTDCRIYGISAWNLDTTDAIQDNLIITLPTESLITVDNMEVAQFIYLLLNNQNIRNAIDSITSKVVLILGSFTHELKEILDAIRKELRSRNYLPVLFDFEKPKSRDLTETISTLAHLSKFIIADLTNARSIPQELERIIPSLPHVPVQPIILNSEAEYSLFEHYRHYPWVLEPFLYRDSEELVKSISTKIIEPAEAKLIIHS